MDQTSKYTQDKITTFTKQTPLSESVFKVPAPHIPASNLQPSKISPYYRSPFVNSDDSQQFIPSKKRMIIQSSPDSTTISPFIKSINRPNEKSPFVNRSSFAVNDDIEEINNPRILKPDVLRDRIAAKKNVVRKEPKVRRTPVMNKEIRKTGNHKLPKKSMRDGNPFFEFEADVVLSDGSGGVIDFVDLESDFENDYELDQDLSGFIASQETPNEEHAMTGVYLQSIVDSKVDEKAIKQHARNLKYLVDNESSDDSMKDFVVDDSNATPEELPRNDVLDLVDDVFESPKKRVAMPKGKSQFVNSRVGNQRPIETDKGKKFEKMVEAPAKTVVSNQFNRSATKPAIKGNNELKPLVFVKPWMKK